VAGNLAEDMHWHSGVGHPGQACMAQAVALELFVAESGDDFIS